MNCYWTYSSCLSYCYYATCTYNMVFNEYCCSDVTTTEWWVWFCIALGIAAFLFICVWIFMCCKKKRQAQYQRIVEVKINEVPTQPLVQPQYTQQLPPLPYDAKPQAQMPYQLPNTQYQLQQPGYNPQQMYAQPQNNQNSQIEPPQLF
ncbi:Hypothetical_protein [Hexamita inflata]|uniref:Hypothetical_protein n=1 Tax=Hexamita inflata TaxID=28002 RepID=A0AA86QR04_9EUKA|nr:Hypothetical protein HINF_LOCUS46567 [Hexamita inflata]